MLRAARFVRDKARSSSGLVDPARGTTRSAQMSGKYSQVGCCRGVVPTCCGCRLGFLFWRCTGAGRGGRVGQGGPGLPLPGSRVKVGQICKSRRTPSLPAHQRNRRGARQGASSNCQESLKKAGVNGSIVYLLRYFFSPPLQRCCVVCVGLRCGSMHECGARSLIRASGAC